MDHRDSPAPRGLGHGGAIPRQKVCGVQDDAVALGQQQVQKRVGCPEDGRALVGRIACRDEQAAAQMIALEVRRGEPGAEQARAV